MELYRKYRPQTLDEIVGNEGVIKSIRRMLETKGGWPHATLITGGSGVGKTTIARIIVKSIGARDIDISEMNIADFRGIDTIRDMIQQASMSSLGGGVKVWILDECHKMSGDAQGCLLKLLEDPPNHAYFILCTTDPEKLIRTIHTRCSTFQMESLSEDQLFKLLRYVAHKESMSVPKEVLEQVAMESIGSARAALVSLEQLIGIPEDEMPAVAKAIVAKQTQGIDLYRALLKKGTRWSDIAAILKDIPQADAEGVRIAGLRYFSALLLNKGDARSYLIMDAFFQPFYNNGKEALVRACYEICQS